MVTTLVELSDQVLTQINQRLSQYYDRYNPTVQTFPEHFFFQLPLLAVKFFFIFVNIQAKHVEYSLKYPALNT